MAITLKAKSPMAVRCGTVKYPALVIMYIQSYLYAEREREISEAEANGSTKWISTLGDYLELSQKSDVIQFSSMISAQMSGPSTDIVWRQKAMI